MTIHLARIAINGAALSLYSGLTGTHDDDGCYALHHALRMRLGDAAPQPFQATLTGSSPHLVGYLRDPDALMDAWGKGCVGEHAAVLDRIFAEQPATKPMPALWEEGARLGFRLRARPVVRYSPEVRDQMERLHGWRPQGGEIDACAAAARKSGGKMDRQEVYREWLAKRLDGSAELVTMTLLDYRRIETARSTHGKPGRRRSTGPDASLGGILQVRDSDAFENTLLSGVGRHSAFGFGMMLLSPAATDRMAA